MSFLGGLAGTLGKILETQDAEQRREASQMRAEDRADMRAFNKEDNIYEKDGKMFSSITLSNGQVIEKPLSDLATKKYKGGILDQKAKDTSNTDILNVEKAYNEAVEKGFVGTKKQWQDSIDQAASDKSWKERNAIEFAQDVKKVGIAASLSKDKADNKPSDYEKTVTAVMSGVTKGDYTITSKDVNSGQARQIFTSALAGDSAAKLRASQILNDPSTVVSKVGTPGNNSSANPTVMSDASASRATSNTPPPKKSTNAKN